jgi:DNA-binding protein HU-beta
MALTKAILSERLAAQSGLSLSQSMKAVDGLVEVLRGAFIAQESISIRGFGTFDVHKRASKVGRDLRTNQPITLPAITVVKFKPFKDLKAEFLK